MSENLDSTILSGFYDGDENAYRQLFDYFYPALFNFAQKLVDDTEEAKDIVLHTFQKLFERNKFFETEANIKAFLFITARNNSLNFLYAQKRQTQLQRDFVRDMNNDVLLRYEYGMMDELVDRVTASVENLPEECRKIFKLLFFEEMKPAEVAAELQISVSTVYVQKNRAIKALRLMLTDHPMVIAWILCALFFIQNDIPTEMSAVPC